MALLFKRIWTRRSAWPPSVCSNINSEKIEEDTFPDYLAGRYYPVNIGKVFVSRYQVVGKFGCGAYSTVWLAKDLMQYRHVALKVFIRSQAVGRATDHELNTYQHITRVSSSSSHPGREAVRSLLVSFNVSGLDGEHHCLVHPPLWDSVEGILRRNPIGRLPLPVLRIVLQQLLTALDSFSLRTPFGPYRMDNIMFDVWDDLIFDQFEQQELESPSPREEVDGHFIYLFRELSIPDSLGPPALCDFGFPNLYRSAELILQVPWSSEIDIWNVGCMIWDMFEGGHPFSGEDPEHQIYRTRAHLASIISLLGHPPQDFITRGALRSKFFSEKGPFRRKICSLLASLIPPARSLDEMETNLLGKDKERFLQFMGKMLQWVPKQRSTAKELLQDSWLTATT
ncbi:serine threonine protein kinase, CMGC group [Parathielavia appendiculata]|uniref:non-specific serine/threonine protein kinase n=1 Tax=Parathielavia appendiculata TaxID=2587402 RepID=A0AAN6TYL4_9PEZI|nr:serine threonine protein kinase, CMGC group [Parathielavia appendiculata]